MTDEIQTPDELVQETPVEEVPVETPVDVVEPETPVEVPVEGPMAA